VKSTIIRQISVGLGAVAVVCGMGLAFSPLAHAQEMTAATLNEPSEGWKE